MEIRKFIPRLLPLWAKLKYYELQGYYKFKFNRKDKTRLTRYTSLHIPSTNYKFSILINCVDEHRHLKSILENEFSRPPETVMDFGCGLGRSSVFFMHMFKWYSTKFLLVDGHKESDILSDKQRLFHHEVKPIFDESLSFYTDFDLLNRFLISNNMPSYELINLACGNERLTQFKNIDLFYSFHSIGYHWDILPTFEYYKLHDLIKPGALLIFGTRKRSDPYSKGLKIEKMLQRGYEKVDERDGRILQKFLILRKK